MTLNQMLVFCILMQNITSKAPSYIEEKHRLVQRFPDPSVLLDTENKEVYDAWMKKWAYMFLDKYKGASTRQAGLDTRYGFNEEALSDFAGR